MAEPNRAGLSSKHKMVGPPSRSAKLARMTLLGAAIAVALLFPSSALAYDTYGGHNLKYGVGNYGASNQHYWIASSASEFESSIDSAMKEWVYTTSYWGITTPISYTQTSVQSSSRMDIRQISSIPAWWAYTYRYNGATFQDPEKGDWVWGRIDLAADFSSCPKVKGAIAHEMGHVMGLAHVWSGTAVMRGDIANMSTRAQPDDLRGINYLY